MPRKKKKRTKTPAAQHNFLIVHVDSYGASAEASINPAINSPETLWLYGDDDPVHELTTLVKINGTFMEPSDRARHRLEMTVYGSDNPSHGLGLRLSEIQERDEHGAPRYRSYRGQQVPVYRPVHGLATLDKVRGEDCWHSWLRAPTAFVGQLFGLLAAKSQLWLAIHELKEGRTRWVRSISLQSIDPAEE